MKKVRSYTYALPTGEHFVAVEDLNSGRKGRYTLFSWNVWGMGARATVIGLEITLADVRRILKKRKKDDEKGVRMYKKIHKGLDKWCPIPVECDP